MARIVVNTADRNPALVISTNVDPTTGAITWDPTKDIIVPCIQDITLANQNGVYTYSAFNCVSGPGGVDMRKISMPADNEVSTNIVLDEDTWFGTAYGTTGPVYVAGNAKTAGLQYISVNKLLIGFKVYWDDVDGVGAGKKYREGIGYVSGVAPTVSPDAPVWVSPFSIAVDGSYRDLANP